MDEWAVFVKSCPEEVVSPKKMRPYQMCIPALIKLSLRMISLTGKWVSQAQELSLQREPKRAVVPLVFLCRLCTVALCVLGCWGGGRRKMLTSCDIFLPAATIGYTRSAERKQSGYCVPLEWPAPILRAPTPPALTTRGIDMRCCCTRASAILWSSSSCPLCVFDFIRGRPCDDRQWYPVRYRPLSESSLLWSCRREAARHNRLGVSGLRAVCVAGGQHPPVFLSSSSVSLFILPTHVHWSHGGMLSAAVVCLVVSVVLSLTCCPQLLICTKPDLMYCSGRHGTFCKNQCGEFLKVGKKKDLLISIHPLEPPDS